MKCVVSVLSVCLLFVAFQIGCSEGPTRPAVETDQASGEISFFQKEGTFFGKIVIQSFGDLEVGVAFKDITPTWLSDGDFNQIFIFAAEDPYPEKLDMEFDEAFVDYDSKGRLTIFDARGRHVISFVLESELELMDQVAEYEGASVYAGFQLARFTGSWSLGEGKRTGDILENLGVTNLFPSTVDRLGKVMENCSEGGPGSSSASISGCTGEPSGGSVTCTAKYYACCNCQPEATCFCVKVGVE